jgi:hypothetical protein
MNAAAYLARAGAPFLPPDHPGDQLVHAPNATVAQITATSRTYDAALAEFRRYKEIREAIHQQILQAVEATYHNVLANEDFGYVDVTLPQLLTHLRTTYATLTDNDLETNRNKLSEPWNPDEPIEQPWL